MEIVLFILIVLLLAWALYERDNNRRLGKAYTKGIEDLNNSWEQGLDELTEMYQGDYLTLHETYEACHNALEATTEELEETTIQMVSEGLELMSLKDLLDAKNTQLEMSMAELSKYEELYAEAATELLDTNNEIDRIAKEVHEWVQPKGSPFD